MPPPLAPKPKWEKRFDREGNIIRSSTGQNSYDSAVPKHETVKQSATSLKPAATVPTPAGKDLVHTPWSREAERAENAAAVVSQFKPDSNDSDDIDSDDLASDTADYPSTDKVKRAAEVADTLKHVNTSPASPPTPVVADIDDLYCCWSRVTETTENAFPDESKTGPAPFCDLDGTPIFVGSFVLPGHTILEDCVLPCRIGPALKPTYISVSANGTEDFPSGRYDILPADELQKMEWVPTSQGRIPQGRRPVPGGYVGKRGTLYHALGVVNGCKTSGGTAEYLGAAYFSHGGREHKMTEGYSLLCWKR